MISAEGALVGGWRTMVSAIDVRTCGLGGDSEVPFDRRCAAARRPAQGDAAGAAGAALPAALATLHAIAAQDRLPDFASQFAFRNPGREPPAHRSALEARVWAATVAGAARHVDAGAHGAGLGALRRLADAGLATIAAFTPSDAMHVLGRQHGWSREAAECGARILATEERNGRALRAAASPQELCERTYELVVSESARALLAAALAQDPGIEDVEVAERDEGKIPVPVKGGRVEVRLGWCLRGRSRRPARRGQRYKTAAAATSTTMALDQWTDHRRHLALMVLLTLERSG